MELHLAADLWIALAMKQTPQLQLCCKDLHLLVVENYALIIGKGKGASIYKLEIALYVVATEENFRSTNVPQRRTRFSLNTNDLL